MDHDHHDQHDLAKAPQDGSKAPQDVAKAPQDVARAPQDVARAPQDVARAMWVDDRASQALGMELVEVSEGRAVLRMEVRPDMLNGLAVCHGGLVFTLADSAMAYSSNSFNQRALATQAEVDWVGPARAGSVLTATAVQRHQRGKAAITDVEVVDETGAVVALFRGRTLQVAGRHLE